MQLDELVFAEAEVAAATGGVRIDLSGVTPSRVEGSQSDLRRLMRNLVDNAVRHADERVAVTLADDNDGVDPEHFRRRARCAPEDRERIFERFTRLDEARARDDGGSGLGLSIVHQIATAHGGSVRVGESSLGGAEFVVRLPSAGLTKQGEGCTEVDLCRCGDLVDVDVLVERVRLGQRPRTTDHRRATEVRCIGGTGEGGYGRRCSGHAATASAVATTTG